MHTLEAFAQKLRRLRRLARPPVTGGAYRWHMNGGHGDVQPGVGAVPAPVGLRTIFVALGASALLAATIFSALPASASGIFVRAANATGPNEADLVTEGPNHTLQYHFATPSSQWQNVQVAGAGSTYSAPSIFVRAADATGPNEADIVAEGPNNTLQYYWATPGGQWHHAQIAGPGTTYSAPSIFVRPDNAPQQDEADIVAEGPNNTLQYYWATPGSPWQHAQVAGPGSTYSAPSIFVRAPGGDGKEANEADIVAEGPNHTLQYHEATPGSPWHDAQVAGPGSTYSG